jgi:hypothetical protein
VRAKGLSQQVCNLDLGTLLMAEENKRFLRDRLQHGVKLCRSSFGPDETRKPK